MTATEAFIANYGLLAVFIGGLLEGETILILAAVVAHHGLLSLPSVFVVAAVAATIGDQIWFSLARYGSDLKFITNLVSKAGVQRALDRVQRHPVLFVLSFRFIYGLRIAGAVACGLSRIPALRFVTLNVVAAAIWTAVILGLGYAFGTAIEAFVGKVGRVEWKILAAIATFAAVFGLFHHIAKRREK